MTSYTELLARKAELDAQISAAEAGRKAEGIAQARALVAEYGLTAADVFPPASTRASGNVGAPKYRDPATGTTWTGRGKPPAWIKDAADRTPFEIQPNA